ncbi:MAG: glycoside hydrolase family 127 protein, partial [Candidatus Symbiothrix sp.]|jgi:hypothetical protein|nr:glycoside hydrolase family 127 protein [Candidatus Symbiothrix sp.]
LGDSYFKTVQDLTHSYLLSLEPDRLCSWFRHEAGLEPKAAPYPGMDSPHYKGFHIPGHILGFYLSSMSMMYETTGDPEIESGDLKHEDYWNADDHWGVRKNVAQTAPIEKIPTFTGSPKEIAAKTKKISDSPLMFKTEGVDCTLIPFNLIHYSRYVLYFPSRSKD